MIKINRKMRVAMLTPSFLPNLGGVEVGLHNICLKLIEIGVEPVVITGWRNIRGIRKNGWKLPYKVRPLIPFIQKLLHIYPKLGIFLSVVWYAVLDFMYKFDFWHVTMSYPTGITLIAYAQYNNTVSHLIRCAGADIHHLKEIGYGYRLDRRIDCMIKKWLPKADALVAISDTVAKEYDALNIPTRIVYRIANGVDLDRFGVDVDTISFRSRLNLTPDDFLFLSVGRNKPIKNMVAVLKAFSEFYRRNRTEPCYLLMIGKEMKNLIPLSLDLGIFDRVRLYNNLNEDCIHNSIVPDFPSDELISAYKSADLFVFPSLMETFGIVIVEAFAAGLPVITSSNHGCKDVCREGKDAFLVDPHNIDEIVDAMEQFYFSETLRKDYSERSLDRAKDFSWRKIARSYYSLYMKIISTKTNTGSAR